MPINVDKEKCVKGDDGADENESAAIVCLNISIFRYRQLVKNTCLWSSDYHRIYSVEMSSEQDAAYAKFWPDGLAKIVHWVCQFLALIPDFPVNISKDSQNFLLTTMVLKIYNYMPQDLCF